MADVSFVALAAVAIFVVVVFVLNVFLRQREFNFGIFQRQEKRYSMVELFSVESYCLLKLLV